VLAERSSKAQSGILLPLIAGLLLVALGQAIPIDWVNTVLNVGILLGLGAVLREKPWRTGAIATLPGAVVSLVRAADTSLATFALFLVIAPFAMVVSGLIVRCGQLLVAGSSRPGDEARRRKPFETQEQRGRFLVVVAIVLVVGFQLLRSWGADEADRDAARRADQMRADLSGWTAPRLHERGTIGLLRGEPLPGGPYDSASPGLEEFRANVELSHRLQTRCVRVQVDAVGNISTEVEKDGCRG
jgi:hypothetical protein